MDIRQLRYFIAIVEARSFSRAAEQLRVAQPALSQHVLAMEAELGVPLLHRSARGVTPTEAGARLIDRARLIEAQLSALPDHVRGLEACPTGEVRFGMPGTVSEQLSVPLIEAARTLYPGVRIRIAEAMSGFVLGWLRDDVVDIAMLYNTKDEKGLVLHQALTEEIQLFSAASMPAAPAGDTLDLSAALALPLIVPSPSHGLRNLIDVAALSIGNQVDPAIEIDSYRQIKRLAARGFAFGMLPAMAIDQEIRDGSFRSWRITRPTIVRRISLGYRADRPLSVAARAIGHLSWIILRDMVHAKAWNAAWTGRLDFQLYAAPAHSERR